MALYKEIVTKAVIGKGKKHYVNNYLVNVDNVVNTVLGCWIINHLLIVGDNHCKIY